MNILYYNMTLPVGEFAEIHKQVADLAGPTIAIPKDWQFLENCSDDQLRTTAYNLQNMARSILSILGNKKDAE